MAAKKSKPHQTGIKDRLSALPDAILCHILSFLPTKNAVVTSLLSTRWKYLYRSVPKIDLDDYLPTEAARRNCSEKTSNGFIRFTNRLFSLRNSANIVTFYLRCSNTYEYWIINDWICAALCRNVQELDIHVEHPAGDHLTGEIFRHERLSSLKLHGFSVKVPEQVFLPNLKILHLVYMTFLADNYHMSKFLLGCPLLEDLNLTDCDLENLEVLDLSIPSLKSLTLRDNYYIATIIISNPNLEYLMLHTSSAEHVVKNLKSLASAELLSDDLEISSKLINELYNVSFLAISGSCFKKLVASGSLSKLQCLTHLDLSPFSEDEFRILPRLLDGTPNLEQLTLGMASIGEFEPQGIVSDLLEVKPLCLAQKLRKVDIFDFVDSETQFNVVEYLLQHGALLELMSFQFVTTKTPEKWPFSMLRRLLMFPRCSKACKIALVE
nr:F-box/LRR-repeat protein At4g14096-like [Coffea arabica]